jgi:hypothetical protein
MGIWPGTIVDRLPFGAGSLKVPALEAGRDYTRFRLAPNLPLLCRTFASAEVASSERRASAHKVQLDLGDAGHVDPRLLLDRQRLQLDRPV